MPTRDDPRPEHHRDVEWFERPTGRHLSSWLDRTTDSRHVASGVSGHARREGLARRAPADVLWEIRLRRNGDVDVTIAVPATARALAVVARVPGSVWGEVARSAGWWSGLHLLHARWPSTAACDLERCAARAERWAMEAAAVADGTQSEVVDVG